MTSEIKLMKLYIYIYIYFCMNQEIQTFMHNNNFKVRNEHNKHCINRLTLIVAIHIYLIPK